MRTAGGVRPIGPGERTAAQAHVRVLAEQGLRSIAIASRPWSGTSHDLEANDEADLTFEGICAFADPPKATCSSAIARLAAAGIRVKILSGDDPVVVKRLAGLVGLHFDTVLSGSDIAELSDEALAVRAQTVDAYGRLAPDQKSRLIKALQSRGEVVGFLGDGINDAPALKVADITRSTAPPAWPGRRR
jgi:Mg2+-importing ATPase